MTESTITPFIHSGAPIIERHSRYDLNASMPSPIEKVEEMLAGVLRTVPSAYNTQPVRMCLLTGKAHRRHWDLIKELLIDKIGEERYAEGTADKIRSFHDAAGTILFFDDETVTEEMKEKFPTYADHFTHWAEQVQGSHQYAAWLGVTELGYGASLQHYIGLDDDRVRQDVGVPDSFRFIAELVFGGMNSTDTEDKEKEPLAKTLKVISE